MSIRSRRPNPVFSDAYRVVREALVEARRTSRMSQREVAERLGKCASHVAMIERGQRRVDALELYHRARIFGLGPAELFERIARGIDAVHS